jgi:hypothetical protein
MRGHFTLACAVLEKCGSLVCECRDLLVVTLISAADILLQPQHCLVFAWYSVFLSIHVDNDSFHVGNELLDVRQHYSVINHGPFDSSSFLSFLESGCTPWKFITSCTGPFLYVSCLQHAFFHAVLNVEILFFFQGEHLHFPTSRHSAFPHV